LRHDDLHASATEPRVVQDAAGRVLSGHGDGHLRQHRERHVHAAAAACAEVSDDRFLYRADVLRSGYEYLWDRR
jgi:hypothetical protein